MNTKPYTLHYKIFLILFVMTSWQTHTNTGSHGYNIPFTELCWTDTWHWEIAATDIAKKFSQWIEDFEDDNSV